MAPASYNNGNEKKKLFFYIVNFVDIFLPYIHNCLSEFVWNILIHFNVDWFLKSDGILTPVNSVWPVHSPRVGPNPGGGGLLCLQ